MKDALIATEQDIFESSSDIAFPESYDVYSHVLTQFRRIEAEYDEEIKRLEQNAMSEVVDYLYSYLDSVYIQDPETFIEAGLSSLTPYLEAQTASEVERIITSYVNENRETLDQIYSSLEREASIWKNNLEALSIVGLARSAEAIRPIEAEEIAASASLTFFNLLAEHEVVARGQGGKR